MSSLQRLVAILTIPCLSYCNSLAINPFFYSLNPLTVPVHSSTTLSDCVPFKDTAVARNNSIQTHSKKDPNTVKRITVLYYELH